jgi:hypothetical protein
MFVVQISSTMSSVFYAKLTVNSYVLHFVNGGSSILCTTKYSVSLT